MSDLGLAKMCPEPSNTAAMPENLTTAVEILANVLYLINLNAEDAQQVRQCVRLAAPAMHMLTLLAEKRLPKS
jgi:hypothetical protein